jgi:hypothetical protein
MLPLEIALAFDRRESVMGVDILCRSIPPETLA